MTRYSGFGIGNKTDFTKTNIYSPSPNTYTLDHESPFFRKKSAQKGKSFGTGR